MEPFHTHPVERARAATGRRRTFLALLLLVLAVPACQPDPSPSPTEIPSPSPTATITATPTETSTPTPSPEPSWYQLLDPGQGALKYQYAEVVSERARVYATFQDAVAGNGNFGTLPDYPAYVAYSTVRSSDDGTRFYLVTYGWMAEADLDLLTPSTFSGLQITRPVPFRFGWVLEQVQSVNATGTPVRSYTRYQVVHEVPAVTERPGFLAVGADEWLPDEAVALAWPGVPQDAGEICRFIYVSLAEQTLSVFQGCQLVFATLISSGQNSWTFDGRFGILYKVEYNQIAPPAESTSEYYIEGVPYFMTYAGNFGFHGAYWHDQFGTAASHGCINLSPADASWLYHWAQIGDFVFISEK